MPHGGGEEAKSWLLNTEAEGFLELPAGPALAARDPLRL